MTHGEQGIIDLVYTGQNANIELALQMAKGLGISIRELIVRNGWDFIANSPTNESEFIQKLVCGTGYIIRGQEEWVKFKTIPKLPNLLRLECRHICGINFPDLYKWADLKLLHISGSSFRDLSKIKFDRFSKLASLKLYHSNITDLNGWELHKCPLRRLSLHGNLSLNDVSELLKNPIKNLEYLSIGDCPISEDSDVRRELLCDFRKVYDFELRIEY